MARRAQTVSVSQKVVAGGYTLGADNVTLTPTPLLQAAFTYIDAAIGSIVAELKAQGLFNTTSIIVTAKHGQSPRNPNLVRPVLVCEAVRLGERIDLCMAFLQDEARDLIKVCSGIPRVPTCREDPAVTTEY